MTVSIEGNWLPEANDLRFDTATGTWRLGDLLVDIALLALIPATHDGQHGFEIQVGIFDQGQRIAKRLIWIDVRELLPGDLRFEGVDGAASDDDNDPDDTDRYCGRCGQKLPEVMD